MKVIHVLFYSLPLVGINGNTFVSPLSVYSALSLALVGSADRSRNEMLTALKLGTGEQDSEALIRSVGEG